MPISKGPLPRRALKDAIPIAQVRGFVQMAGTGYERIMQNFWENFDMPRIYWFVTAFLLASRHRMQ